MLGNVVRSGRPSAPYGGDARCRLKESLACFFLYILYYLLSTTTIHCRYNNRHLRLLVLHYYKLLDISMQPAQQAGLPAATTTATFEASHIFYGTNYYLYKYCELHTTCNKSTTCSVVGRNKIPLLMSSFRRPTTTTLSAHFIARSMC